MSRKSRRTYRVLIYSVILLIGITVLVIYSRKNAPRFIHYDGFGIDIPTNYGIHGIDVSRYQHDIDWADVKKMQVKDIKIGFAFMKATEGLGRVDVEFRDNWQQAGDADMPRGAYHFFSANKSGKAQAENFIETVNLRTGDMPPVLDIETVNGADIKDIQQRAQDWLNIVEKKYHVRPIIYTNVDFYKNYLEGKFDEYPLWVAHYLVKDRPRIKRDWLIWQHNEKGRVNGIDAFVDFNVFNGDSADFKAILIK